MKKENKDDVGIIGRVALRFREKFERAKLREVKTVGGDNVAGEEHKRYIQKSRFFF